MCYVFDNIIVLHSHIAQKEDMDAHRNKCDITALYNSSPPSEFNDQEKFMVKIPVFQSGCSSPATNINLPTSQESGQHFLDEGSNNLVSKLVFRCPLCPFWTTPLSAFHSHFLSHEKEPPFKCSYCNYRVRCRSSVLIHIKKKGSGHFGAHCLEPLKPTKDQYKIYMGYEDVPAGSRSGHLNNHALKSASEHEMQDPLEEDGVGKVEMDSMSEIDSANEDDQEQSYSDYKGELLSPPEFHQIFLQESSQWSEGDLEVEGFMETDFFSAGAVDQEENVSRATRRSARATSTADGPSSEADAKLTRPLSVELIEECAPETAATLPVTEPVAQPAVAPVGEGLRLRLDINQAVVNAENLARGPDAQVSEGCTLSQPVDSHNNHPTTDAATLSARGNAAEQDKEVYTVMDEDSDVKQQCVDDDFVEPVIRGDLEEKELACRKEIGELVPKMRTIQQELGLLELEGKRLSHFRNKSRDAIMELEAKLAVLDKNDQDLLTRISELKNMYDEKTKQMNQLNTKKIHAEINVRTRQCELLRLRLSVLDSANSEETKKLSEMEVNVAEAEHILNEFIGQLTGLGDELKQLNQQIDVEETSRRNSSCTRSTMANNIPILEDANRRICAKCDTWKKNFDSLKAIQLANVRSHLLLQKKIVQISYLKTMKRLKEKEERFFQKMNLVGK